MKPTIRKLNRENLKFWTHLCRDHIIPLGSFPNSFLHIFLFSLYIWPDPVEKVQIESNKKYTKNKTILKGRRLIDRAMGISTQKCTETLKKTRTRLKLKNTKIRSLTSNLTFNVAALLSEPSLPIPELLLGIRFRLQNAHHFLHLFPFWLQKFWKKTIKLP